EKVSICLRDTLNVFWRNAPLVLAVALAQPLHQYIATGLKIYDQIRFWQARTEERKELAIERQFVGFEVGLGKDLILGKQVVGDRVLIEQILLHELALLAVAAEQEEQLRLEGVGARLFVELAEERIFFDLFENRARVELFSEET